MSDIEKKYPIPEAPEYDTEIRSLQNTDPANADEIFNPLIQKIIDNIHAVKLSDDKKAKEDLSNVLDSVFLEKVKTVGGSGSNLDADTVDGKHAADFAPAGFGLGTVCKNLPNGSDLNNLPEAYKHTTGFFMGANLQNKPSEIGGGWCYLIQMAHYETNILQMCFELSAVKETGNIFIRQYMEGSYKNWTPWKKPDASTIAGKDIHYLLNYNNLTNKPSNMPANGGNADTVDGKHANELQDYNKLTGKLVINNQIGVQGEEFSKYDGADYTACNIDILSWYGLGILSTCNNPEKVRTITFNARNGDIKTKGQIYADTNKKVWHEGNDGTASGLDADMLDGRHAKDFKSADKNGNYFLSNFGDTGINLGDGDGATFEACNMDIQSHYGIGIKPVAPSAASVGRTIVINARNGDIKTKGQIYAATDKKVWHEGNDGATSGLDADMLDGKHASAFAPSGFGLGTNCIIIPDGTDLNNLPVQYKHATGFFTGGTLVNKPKELNGWIYLFQISGSPAYKVQMAFNVNGTDSLMGDIFIRQCKNNVWTAWKKPDASTVGGKSVSVLYSNCSATAPTAYLGDNVQYQVY